MRTKRLNLVCFVRNAKKAVRLVACITREILRRNRRIANRQLERLFGFLTGLCACCTMSDHNEMVKTDVFIVQCAKKYEF